MSLLIYATHPQVQIDLVTPVADWELSELGLERARRFAGQPWLDRVGRIVTSTERKAVQTAELLGDRLRLPVESRSDLGENDRSATGPLPPEEFDATADLFFAKPEQSIRGWERAIDAQRRVVAALSDLLTSDSGHDIVVIGHGGVGTLWYCHLSRLPIERRHDQPSQGHYFTVDLGTRRPLHAWRPIDDA